MTVFPITVKSPTTVIKVEERDEPRAPFGALDSAGPSPFLGPVGS